MIELVVYLALVAAIAGAGVRIGMIVAGRIDRRQSPPQGEPATPRLEESS